MIPPPSIIEIRLTTDVPSKADVIICLAGSDDRINKAVWLLGEGLAEKVAVTTDAAYQEMLKKKVSPDKILKANWSPKIVYYWVWHGVRGIVDDPQWAI